MIPIFDETRGAEGRGRTVLVADDDAAVGSFLKRLLEAEGITVRVAEDGVAALDLFAELEPDLVLLDVLMPKVGGLEVCRRLKGSPESRLVPIVMVTGLEAREDRIDAIEAGADDFLSKPFDRVELVARVKSLLRMKRYTDELERAESVLLALGRTVEERDAYTRGHCERLAELSAELGRRLGLGEQAVSDLRRGGYLHDIGKVIVPDAVLQKKGALTSAEMEVIREHPAAGERICRGLRSLRLVLPIIRHHHERLDGSGYPDGLEGDEIPLGARILQVVDVYDALITERSYKRALGPEEALEVLNEEVERGWWDAEIFATFREMMSGRAPAVGG
ncbi:MAG TPA: HD domain-containing phosphohydrolase [Longimicrobiales bacterium]|nr:HD domain-containing phosphohydrolase [Longimicrobiales bacterium]